ncbi:peptidyl-prolyl cis-trans isomerase [Rhodocytophaga rosea]|uniref:Peptidyl-prolyl cis-trans isomerase n=1 Tax=Rhodocytophaga rosea TaxID=2704465 RepID=A0A6C0GDD9_9BACT|nr:peptidyl-prolyl cis-trans isomerase [Rhodocytophaga rosea]QHT65971.1 peptidyl-prolyl cis-trans isomerase [Rhodocytophaga rosea]
MRKKLKNYLNKEYYRKTRHLFIGVWIMLLSNILACQEKAPAVTDKLLASVGEKKLHQSDLEGLVSKGVTATDSTTVVSNYINAWVRKQVMLAKAQKEAELDESEIERKIADYRYDLTIYAFEKQYIQQHLDTVVSAVEIEAYYTENVANFELKQNIVQGVLIGFPQKYARTERIKKLLGAKDKRSRQELQNICFQQANFYVFTDSTWTDFDELVKNTPFREMPNKTQFLKGNKFAEANDERGVYLLGIDDYKIASQTSPLAFASDQIKSIILNNRKVQLIRNLEQEIYKQAQDEKKIKIYAD